MDKVFIYTLAHPETGLVRYVGKTNNIVVRFKGVKEEYAGFYWKLSD